MRTVKTDVAGLQPNTTYYYSVISGQGEGTGTRAQNRVEQFKTR